MLAPSTLLFITAAALQRLGSSGPAMPDPAKLTRHAASLWGDPLLATGVAATAVLLLLVALWLLRRRSREGRGAALICLLVSAVLHVVLVVYLPKLAMFGAGRGDRGSEREGAAVADVVIATFDPAAPLATTGAGEADASGEASLSPLPLGAPLAPPLPVAESAAVQSTTATARPPQIELPESLRSAAAAADFDTDFDAAAVLDDLLAQWLSTDPDTAVASSSEPVVAAAHAESPPEALEELVPPPTPAAPVMGVPQGAEAAGSPPAADAGTPRTAAEEQSPAAGALARVSDFANRYGDAKRLALLQGGGDEQTEAAVEAALRFLVADQRPNGSWDPATSGAGRETHTLGTDRRGAGRRATTGLTGLALLSLLGAGNTHQHGPYADNVRRGLTYLILHQQPNGSLAGDADVYEANYCHGFAALAMCEAAAMTGDPSAIDSAASAIRYTLAMQHPVTGGWRYVRGDPGDMSQLGWQALVLDTGRMAGIAIPPQTFQLTLHFIRSVRGGQQGGLASYRPGDGPTRTMTAEALAIRLLFGEHVPAGELEEAQQYMLRQLPGVGRDNYYRWYYTSLALHQLQDEAWQVWNAAMKQRLLGRQHANGSWPTDSEWGGYGGRIYTTAMATLCLQVYYRHDRRTPTAAP